MNRFLRVIPCRVCILVAVAATGCRSDVPLSLPDAAHTSGLTLSSTPDSLVIRPGSSGRVRFILRDEQSLPVPDYLIDFSIVSDAVDGGVVGAQLSTEQGLTDHNGMVVQEIIVGNLASDNRSAAFVLRAQCLGSPPAATDILVTTNAYSVEILPVSADALLASGSGATTRLLFYDDTTCAELDIDNLNASPKRPRTPRVVAMGSSLVFSGVSAKGSHAVVGLGMDSGNTVRVGGCIDVLGPALLESDAIRATLFMDHVFPVPTGSYQAVSSFKFSAPLSATVAIQSAWQQWARCPFDPARLWLDCTIDTLVSNPITDPNDCIPVPGAEGPLGDLLSPRRGTPVAALKGTVANGSDAACHDHTDNTGRTSLEVIVDALFSSARAQLASANLGGFPTEIATLLDNIRIDSDLTVAEASQTNSCFITHNLTSVTFPDAPAPNSLKTLALGLPVTTSSWILAAFKRDQIVIPQHGFTLRLGTSARYAFQASSLTMRGAQDAGRLVKSLFSQARLSDQGTVLTGCNALDAVVCDEIKQPRSCLLAACQVGLDALAQKLSGVFDNLNGDGLDFFLSGSAPVADLDGDGQVDALGMDGSGAAGTAGPGVWSAEIRSRVGSYVTFGLWSASRVANLP